MNCKNKKSVSFVAFQLRTDRCIKQYVVNYLYISVTVSREALNWIGYVEIRYLKLENSNWDFNISGISKTNIRICIYKCMLPIYP
jgi:hypothetical protein